MRLGYSRPQLECLFTISRPTTVGWYPVVDILNECLFHDSMCALDWPSRALYTVTLFKCASNDRNLTERATGNAKASLPHLRKPRNCRVVPNAPYLRLRPVDLLGDRSTSLLGI